MRIKNRFLELWLILGICSGFGTVIFFTIVYLNEKILCNLECRKKNELLLVMILLSLFGLFIGSLLYYFISEKNQKKISKLNKNIDITLNFLDPDMRKVVRAIIEKGGEISQSNIVKDTKIARVKVSRILLKLEQKDILCKTPNGMTNTISLNKKMKELFLQ